MVRVLIAEALRRNRIQRLDYHFTVDLIVEDGRCCGALVLDEHSGRSLLPARAVVSTTEPDNHARTTNPANATGDGVAMALRAGAAGHGVRPIPPHGPVPAFEPALSLSEAMRRGAHYATARAKSSCSAIIRWQPAPRDIVSRATAEMAATKSRHVYLDVTHLCGIRQAEVSTIYSTACGTTSTSPKSGSPSRRAHII